MAYEFVHCKQKFISYGALDSHNTNKHRGFKIGCGYCGNRFGDSKSQSQHCAECDRRPKPTQKRKKVQNRRASLP